MVRPLKIECLLSSKKGYPILNREPLEATEDPDEFAEIPSQPMPALEAVYARLIQLRNGCAELRLSLLYCLTCLRYHGLSRDD